MSVVRYPLSVVFAYGQSSIIRLPCSHFRCSSKSSFLYVQVQVISPLPVIELYCEQRQPSEHVESDEPARTGAGDQQPVPPTDRWQRIDSLTIYSGETQDLRLIVRNQGEVPALRLDLRWVGEDGDTPEVEFETKLIEDYLPLLPGTDYYGFTFLRLPIDFYND